MKCPGCGGEVPHVAVKCKHCGAALKKQAPPAAAAKPAPKAPRPEDPMRALAREALAQQKAKRGDPGKPDKKAEAAAEKKPAKAPAGAEGQPAAGGPKGPKGEGAEGEEAEAFEPAPPPDPRRRLLINGGVGLALMLGAAGFSQTDYAQRQLASWSAGTAVRDVEFDMVEGEWLGAGAGQLRAPTGFSEVPDAPEGQRMLSWDMKLNLIFLGRREFTFTLQGKRMRYDEALAQAKAIDPAAGEFNALYGKNAFRVIRYKQPPADGSAGRLRTLRFYQSKKETEYPFSVEFGYIQTSKNRVVMDRLIDRILTSLIE